MTATYADTGHFIKDSVTAHATAKSRNRGSGINHESREYTKINARHNSVISDGHDTRITESLSFANGETKPKVLESRKLRTDGGHPTVKPKQARGHLKNSSALLADPEPLPNKKDHPVHDGKKTLYYKLSTKGVKGNNTTPNPKQVNWHDSGITLSMPDYPPMEPPVRTYMKPPELNSVKTPNKPTHK